ncbi:MAG: MFS transporter [Nocardioides sp.]
MRALLSFGAAFTAEWAFTVAVGLVAYAEGGAWAVGLLGLARLVPAALLAPVVTAYADRMPPERLLVASSALRGLATTAAALVLLVDGPVVLVYGFVVVATVSGTPFRAAHSALLPALCHTPDELTAVNVARGGLDSASVVVGPLVAALLLAVSDVAAVFVFSGLCGLLSAALLLRLDYDRTEPAAGRRRGLAAEVREGFVAVGSEPGVAVVVGLVVLQAMIRGAFGVLVVVVAIDLLRRDEASVGVLQAAVGVGALVGSLCCVLLVGSRAMTRWLGVAVVLWGLPLAVVGLLPSYAVALVAAGVIGVGNALVDVTAFTLLARMTPQDVMARVFGVLESLGALAVGLGSLLAPVLIGLLGVPGALAAVGALAPVVCVLRWRRLTAIDRSVGVRTDAILLLRQVPMLRPLSVPVLERLAQGVRRVEAAAGETVFEAGDLGDSFYVVDDGTVRVLDGGRAVRTLGRGEGFGEIALLGRTRRTMTVRAVDAVRLCRVPSDVFLPAVTSMSEARAVAEATRRSHLDHAPGTSPSTSPGTPPGTPDGTADADG